MNSPAHSIKYISPDDLVCMDEYIGLYPIYIELAYARNDNLLFAERIYKKDAKLWLHKDMARVTLQASEYISKHCGGSLIIYDGLRVTDAQNAMLKTKRVGDNPQWLEEPRLLSPPGNGGHPRAMAVDVSIIGKGGEVLDMGTAFDFLAEDPSPANNSAHRDYDHSSEIQENRALLDEAMLGAAKALDIPLIGLPQEWWDFRMPAEVYNQYAPLSDSDLPEHMRLMD